VARTFAGGVRLNGRKGLISGKPVVSIPAPSRVIIHLSQHAGAPARAVVRPGDAVKIGDRIGEADGPVSVPVHSSVSGKVKSIADFPHPAGGSKPAVEIDNDGKDDWVDLAPCRDLTGADPRAVRDAVREAGIVGLGGGGFPTHVKITPPPDRPIDTVILNGAECEPYLSADHRVMLEHTPEVVEGLKALLRVLDARRGIVAVQRDKADAASRLRQEVASDPRLEVAELKVRYPCGAEKMLIASLTGRRVPRGGVPADVGCLVHNVATVFAVNQALKFGRPLVSRVVTLAGRGAGAGSGNFRVRIGTPVHHVIESAGADRVALGMIILGGPMTGLAQATADVPVIKCTTGIILLSPGERLAAEPGPCIRCGRCVERCPMRLLPNEIARSVEKGRPDLARHYGLADCIECGVCAYVCPSKIKHVDLVRQGKLAAEADGKEAA
jgi:electron transport complex protein RnfC